MSRKVGRIGSITSQDKVVFIELYIYILILVYTILYIITGREREREGGDTLKDVAIFNRTPTNLKASNFDAHTHREILLMEKIQEIQMS